MREYSVKRKKLEEIEQFYKFNFKDGVNTKTMGKNKPYGIIFYQLDLEAVLTLHNGPIVSTPLSNDWLINRLLVKEGSISSLLYLNYQSKMKLNNEFIVEDVGEVVGFNGSTSKYYG